MFSGLTNQVSSWVGAAKGEPKDEEVPTPTKEPTDNPSSENPTSPTKGGSKLDLITNVKSQMSGWLGSGIPIPGLRKTEAEGQPVEQAPIEPSTTADQSGNDADDDKSRYISATGGADSGPASPAGTPTEEGAAAGVAGNAKPSKIFTVEAYEVPDFNELTTKAVAGAKSLGNFLYSAVNKAGAKVSETTAKIKKTVEENSILGELNKEQEAFLRTQDGKGGPAVAPWIGQPNEQALKEECLSLSKDRRNFVRAPPAGVEFEFDYDRMYPVATAIMADDPDLEKMRFDLVPKIITEENFWRNYFYRISLICQANEADAANTSTEQDESLVEAKDIKLDSCIEEAKERIKSLKVDANEEQWEKELEAELNEFEVVADKNVDDKNWEKECEQLLSATGTEDEDLK